jgi:hypothetical protein
MLLNSSKYYYINQWPPETSASMLLLHGPAAPPWQEVSCWSGLVDVGTAAVEGFNGFSVAPLGSK